MNAEPTESDRRERNLAVVRASFDAYRRQDRAAAEAVIGADFRFTSPQDDHIGRSAYFERCFPTADRFRSTEFLHLTAIDDRTVLAVYEYELRDGARHRNAELLTVRDGRIVETQVFFGGRYDDIG